ncbi:MAG: hypothetical protein QY302_11315 [Anaerolineales bacterium]|nr:MAG: hypothetical protein QY302_11315 [Anaerolineales bacterium]
MERVLRAGEVELIGPWDLSEDICARIGEVQPNVVVVADEDARGEESARLTTAIMEQYPELPVVRTGLTENVVRVHSTYILPARGADLLETIRNLPVTPVGKPSDKRSK